MITFHQFYMFPICWPASDGSCGCGKRHTGHDIGKAPMTPQGHKNASIDPKQFAEWQKEWPLCNWGISLEPSRLVVIGPDSTEWLDRFEQFGLPPTITAQTGGGAGHKHFYYSRPLDCPVHRSCKPDEYDVLSNGYVVAPPSIHMSGNRYKWLSKPSEWEVIPPCPAWAVDMLVKAKAPPRQTPSPPHIASAGDPPVQLGPSATSWWNGQSVKRNAQGIDRSATLYVIGLILAGAGANESQVTDALRERDISLGLEKYSTRPEERAEKAYRDIAVKALSQQTSNGQRTTPDISRITWRSGYA
jgi:hypothetical protein